ncbi:hypothetical protein Tco_0441642 [Tanacetum coccineum]
MSTRLGPSPTAPTFGVRNKVGQGKEMSQGNLNGPVSDAALREYCDKYYNQLLPILFKKMHQEKVQQEKLKAVKAHLNFEEVSQHSESGTPSRRRDLRKSLRSRRICSVSGMQEDNGSHDPKSKGQALKMAIYPSHGYARKLIRSLLAFAILISQKGPVCQVMSKHMTEVRIQKTPQNLLSGGKSGMLGDANMVLHQKKCIKDPMEIPHIKQREGESTEDFMRRFKIKSRDVKGVPEIMRISGFMHGITNPELIKCLHDKIPKSVDEMMKITTFFLRGRWQMATKSRSHFRHGNIRSPDVSRISGKEALKINKGQNRDMIDLLFS